MKHSQHRASFILLLVSTSWLVINGQSQKLIADGRRVLDNEAKWHVAIVSNRRLKCSGSLIRNQIVLTSASCVKDLETSKILVRSGSKTFKTGGQVRKVVDIVHHPKHNDYEHSYNIALMKLTSPFNGTDIAPVRLPTSKDVELPSSVLVFGWGISNLMSNSTLSKQLRVSKYRVYSDKNCFLFLPENDKSDVSNTFCVGDRSKLADICNDDLGAAATDQNSVQYGIVSNAGACSKKDATILTYTVSHLPWIKRMLQSWKKKNPL